MNSLYIIILAIYLGLVGINDNGNAFLTEVEQDVGGFIPWFFSVLTLSFVAQIKVLSTPAKALFALAVLTMILKNKGPIQQQFQQLYNSLNQTQTTVA